MIKKIPVFGTQSLNSLTNLKNFIKSIDYPIETLSLVVNSENINFFLELKSFCDSEVDKNLINSNPYYLCFSEQNNICIDIRGGII